MRCTRTLPLLLLGLASCALAQTHFCIAGDLEHLNATQVTDCKAKMTTMREAVKRRGAPSGWHFVVVCDETGWSDYATWIAPRDGSLNEAAFHTEKSLHWTFVRGSQMDAGNPEGADTLLTVALKGIPNPGIAPYKLPNPRRVPQEPSLSVASIEPPRLP